MIALTNTQELICLIGVGCLILIGLCTMRFEPPRRRPPHHPGSHKRMMAELDRIQRIANHPSSQLRDDP